MILAPLAKQRFYDNNNNPLNKGQLFCYVAGTTTKQTTYSDAAGTPNTNPVILNYRGECDLWLDPIKTYKFVLAPANDTDPPTNAFWTVDNIPGGFNGNINVDLIPSINNTYNLGSSSLAWKQLYLGANKAPIWNDASQILGYYGQTPAELAASVTPVNLYLPSNDVQGEVIVKREGAAGDGVTVDTTAFSNALSVLSGGITSVPRTSSSYIVGAVNITIPSTIEGGGKITFSGANAGFKLNANMAGMKLYNLEVVGDGNTANLHRLIWNDQTKTISGINISGVYVRACTQNIDISSVTDSSIIGNRIDSAAGSSAGQGYGIVASKSQRIAQIGNTFYNNGRHSIYNSSANYNVIAGNISYQNAGTVSKAAFAISRLAVGIPIVGNVLAEYVGTGITIDADNADGNGTCRAIQVVGQVFYQAPGSTNENPDIAIGSSFPATNTVQTVSVRGNSFTSSPVRQNGFIAVTNGFNIDISDNIWDAYLGTVAGQIGINLDTSAGAAYYDRIRICGNTGVIASSGGATTFITVGANICTGTQSLDIFNNTVTCGSVISYATDPPTNPNIRHDVFFTRSVTLAAGAQDLNIAGYYDFAITGNGGGSTINNIANGYAGKVITLRFADANVTLTRTNSFLSGSVNFTSANHAILVLKFLAGQWFEVSRSLDG